MAIDAATYATIAGSGLPTARIESALAAAAYAIAEVYGPEPKANRNMRATWRSYTAGVRLLNLPHRIDSVTSVSLGDTAISDHLYLVSPYSIQLSPYALYWPVLTFTALIPLVAVYKATPQGWRDNMQLQLAQLDLAWSGYDSLTQANITRSAVDHAAEYQRILYRYAPAYTSGPANLSAQLIEAID